VPQINCIVAVSDCGGHYLVTDRAQVGRHLLSQHLLQAESEQVRRVATVGSRDHVSAETGRSAWPPVASGAAVREPCTQRPIFTNVAD